HDLLPVCHTEGAGRAAASALVDAYRSGTLPVAALERSVARVRHLRERRTTRFEGGEPHAERDGRMLASAMAARAVAVVNAGAPGFVRRLNGKVAVIFPRFSALA